MNSSNYVTPIPELVVYNVVKQWADKVNAGEIQTQSWVGISNEELTRITTRLPPIKVGFTYPMTDTELPFISLVTELVSPLEHSLGRVIEETEERRVYATLNRADLRLFVVTNNPETTIVFTDILYAYLLGQVHGFIATGLTEPEISISTLSPWANVLPNIGFRREISLSFVYESYYTEEILPAEGYEIEILDSDGNLVVEFEKKLS